MSYWVARRSSSTGARSSWVRCRASSRSAAICCFRSMVLAEAPQTNPARLATAPKSPAVDHRYVLLCDSLVLRLCRDYHYGRGCSAAATYRMPTVQLTRTHVRGRVQAWAGVESDRVPASGTKSMFETFCD